MSRVFPLLAAGCLLVSACSSENAGPHDAGAARALIRVNQVGYRLGDPKRALLMASDDRAGATFRVLGEGGDEVMRSDAGPDLGKWNDAYPHVHALDLSSLETPGKYRIVAAGATSPPVAIDAGATLHAGLLENARFFYRAQRDGADVDAAVLERKPSHLDDESAFVYAPPTYAAAPGGGFVLEYDLSRLGDATVDVSGGWFDAAGYVKRVETTSYVVAAMLLAVRDHPELSAAPIDFRAEARFGIDWLRKAWDDDSRTLYYQVGLDGGNGDIAGDRDRFRLPEDDGTLDVAPGDAAYYLRYRPAFQAGLAGAKVSPNLAGRLAADFALCSQVFRADDAALADACLLASAHVYELADTAGTTQLTTAAPYEAHPETSFTDDLELGAIELHLALASASGSLPAGLPNTDPAHYLALAASWAADTIATNSSGSLHLYDVGGLAHRELHHALVAAGSPAGLAVTRDDVLADLAAQLEAAAAQAGDDPFGLAVAYDAGDTAPRALGVALLASLHDELAGGTSHRALGLSQRDWVLGANPWGASLVVGAGETFPHCVHHAIANLSGALDGTSPILLGAVVAGPSAADDGALASSTAGQRACPGGDGDPFAAFSGQGARFRDDVRARGSVEPSIDRAALSILLFARQSWLSH